MVLYHRGGVMSLYLCPRCNVNDNKIAANNSTTTNSTRPIRRTLGVATAAATPQVANQRPKQVPQPRELPVAIADDTSLSDAYVEKFIQASEKIRVELRVVTPDWAAQKLKDCNKKNRRLTAERERRIAVIIERGAWEVNGETIVFDENDILANGQGRLSAIARSGIAVPCLIVYGVSPDAFATFDQQKKRSTQDILSIEHVPSVATTAAALGWLKCYRLDQMASKSIRQLDNDEVIPLLKEFPGLGESVAFSANNSNSLIPPGMMAFLHYVLSRKNKEECEKLLTRTAEGVDVASGSHIHLLRRRLMAMEKMRGHGDQYEIAGLIIKTWNRIRANEAPGSVLVFNPDVERFPVASD